VSVGHDARPDPRLVELLSYYRDAELHGAGLLLRLVRLMADDPDAQVKLTRHVAEETRHAWLWTKRIVDLGAVPLPIADGYQARIGLRILPRSVAELLALTVVVESRSLARYREHAARPGVDPATRAVLRRLTRDERWHLEWIQTKLAALTRADATARQRAQAVAERYGQVEAAVYAELAARERAAFGGEPAW
jgi:bacterioferritin (cytochrome b1)